MPADTGRSGRRDGGAEHRILRSSQTQPDRPADTEVVADPDGVKNFPCSYPGCKKVFSRLEHVNRHALNHTPGSHTCPQCRAHFKRPDLLQRHMNRHRQKDSEASNLGGGVLQTRKRAWKALDGSIVQTKDQIQPQADQEVDPRVSERRQTRERMTNSGIPEYQSQVSQAHFPVSVEAPFEAPVSPISNPRVLEDYSEASGCSPVYHDGSEDRAERPSSEGGSFGSYTDDLSMPAGPFQFGSNQFPQLMPGNAPIPPYSEDHSLMQLDFAQIFQPDTASSFNMPYTTALDYNWLLSSSAGSTSNQNLSEQIFPGAQQQLPGRTFMPNTQLGQPQRDQSGGMAGSYPHFPAITPESLDSSDTWVDNTGAPLNEPIRDSRYRYTPDVRQMPPGRSPEHGSNPSLDLLAATAIGAEQNRQTPMSVTPSQAHMRAPQILHKERPLGHLVRADELPIIDDHVRDRLLGLVEIAKPHLPDHRYTIRESPLLSTAALNSYLDLYFTHFNSAYPLIHLATFSPGDTDPLLLLAIVLLGATYTGKDSHQLAVCIHDVIRPCIFAHADFSPTPELWTLQAILLVECFGKSRAGQKQHDMSHLFHGLLINLIRRSDCQSVQPQGPSDSAMDEDDLSSAWEKWAENEQKKRLALLCFMWDTQHAVLFRQSLCMSSFELRVSLPCAQSVWEAPDAISWAAAWRASNAPPSPPPDDRIAFLAALKAHLSPAYPRRPTLTTLSRVLVFHGLMSVAWDMERREQTALGVTAGVAEKAGGSWRQLLGAAYDAWHVDFSAHGQTYIVAHLADSDSGPERAQFGAYLAAYTCVYHSAKALLNMEFLDVQIYAGARHILGRPVQQKDYLRSAQIVKAWAAAGVSQRGQHELFRHGDPAGAPTDPASVATWHAAQTLQEGTMHVVGTEAMSLLHVPWCLYLATLTCWTFYNARPRQQGRHRGGSFDDEDMFGGGGDETDWMVWDPKGDTSGLISAMSTAESPQELPVVEKRRTSALVWVMASELEKVRWGIIRSAVVVLRGLVPQRMINQYD